MSFKSRQASQRVLWFTCLLTAGVTWNGVTAEKIQVYRVPKEIAQANPPPGHSADDGHNHGDVSNPHAVRATPKVTYTTPEGWREAGAGDMRVAGFTITGANGQTAQVAITPLPGMAGKEGLIVNMWRQQVGLSELTADEVEKQLTPVDIGGEPGKMFDMAGKSSAGETMRIVTAMAQRDGLSWFYKLQGSDELVTAQKPNFVTFLKSVKIEDPTAPGALPDGHPPVAGTASATPPAAPTTSTAEGPTWPAPADWKRVSPGAMQVAKFTVPEVGGAKADVTISVFPNSTGGTLANVNRWRNQIGLTPVDESALAQMVKPLDAKIPEALVADLSNGNRRLLGAIVPNGGQWYFYKLLGEDAAIAPQREAFTKFVKEVKY